MKLVTVYISRKEHAKIQLAIEDDQDENLLQQAWYGSIIESAADMLDPEWSDATEDKIEVEYIGDVREKFDPIKSTLDFVVVCESIENKKAEWEKLQEEYRARKIEKKTD